MNDVAKRLAPHLRIVSASRPTPVLRNHNVLAIAESAEVGRQAVLALEAIEYEDEKLGTVVMGAAPSPSDTDSSPTSRYERPDPERVSRQVLPRILTGGALGGLVGALLLGGGSALLGATGWRAVGAAVGGAMLFAVFGAIWVTFAGFGGSDAYRQTFVDDDVTELTIVSVHTDEAAEAQAAQDRLSAHRQLRLFTVDRFGRISRVGSTAGIRSTEERG